MSKYKILKILLSVAIVPAILLASVSAVSLASAKINQCKQDGDILKIYFEAKDENGSRILNLSEKNIDLFAAGDKIEIGQVSSFATTGEKVAYIALIDISTSIRQSHFAAVCEAISLWIDKMDSGEKMAIVTFGEKIAIVSDFTDEKEKLKQRVAGLKNSDPATQLYGGLVKAAEMLKISDSTLPDRRAVIVFTDGQNGISSTYTKDEAIGAITEAQAPFYAAAFTPSSKDAGEALADFGSVMRKSGGDLYEIKGESNISDVFEQIYFQISDIYVASAKIPGHIRDGEPKKLRLSVSVESRNIEENIDFKFTAPKNQPESSESAPETGETENASEPQPETTAAENASETHFLTYAAIFAGPAIGIICFVAFFLAKRKNKIPLPPDKNPSVPEDKKIPDPNVSKTVGAGMVGHKPERSGGTKPLFSHSNVSFTVDISEFNTVTGVSQEHTATMESGTSIRIGRDPNKSDILILDETVSGEQCIVKAGPDGLGMINKSKTNRTILEENPVGDVEYAPMPSLSKVKIGMTELTIRFRK